MSRHHARDPWTLLTLDALATAPAGGLGPHVPTSAVPDEATRRDLAVGALAGLVFARETARDDAQGKYERLWVEVLEAGEGRYVGELDNQPTYIRGLDNGARVEFGPEHVFAVMKAPRWTRPHP